jgi:hypothetical protein
MLVYRTSIGVPCFLFFIVFLATQPYENIESFSGVCLLHMLYLRQRRAALEALK